MIYHVVPQHVASAADLMRLGKSCIALSRSSIQYDETVSLRDTSDSSDESSGLAKIGTD
jgi:hypothetical protein